MQRFHSRLVSATTCCVIVTLVIVVESGFAQQASKSDHDDHDSSQKTLTQQLTALQEKVAQLEAMLKQQHSGQSSSSMKDMGGGMKMGMGGGMMKGMGKGMSSMKSDSGSSMQMSDSGAAGGMSGMGGMGMGMGMMKSGGMGMGMMKSGGMGMGGMGMGMMGRMKGMSQMQMAASLPGFPGASHIYHIGATSFFLDHSEHITLPPEQQTRLNKIKEETLLAQNTLDRQIEESEQQLWVLTSADSPDAKAIEALVGEIAKLTGEKRISFIRAVGVAAEVLSDEQRKTLTGMLPPDHTATDSGAASAQQKTH